MTETSMEWFKVAELDELSEGRVMSVTAGTRSLALVHFDGQYAAMDNHCPHQGGPLGEGAIEKGVDGECWLRCPWHGWDFDPLTGKPPGGHEDTGQETFPVEARGDGIYVGVPKAADREATVSDQIVDSLTNWGLDTVFGMVGHSNLGLADALRIAEGDGRLNYYAIRHEGAASFAASGYGKLTGKPAGCLAIAGPGATNMMTGLWDAKVDRAPILALTGQVQEQVIGVHAFQDIDLEAAFQPVSRFSETVRPNSNHGELAAQAMKTALVETDVSHLIFPDNVQVLPRPDAKPSAPDGRIGSHRLAPDPDSVGAATAAIAAAKRPMIIVGYGARDAMDGVIALAEKLNAPVATTFKAKGQIADRHPLAAGVLGRSGTPIASWFMNEADLLIVFGASFSDHTGIYPSAKTIQVDLDPMRLAKRHPVDVPVRGEVGVTAGLFADAVNAAGLDQRGEIAERWALWREEKATRIAEDNGKGVNAAAVFDALTRLAPEDAILTVDVGNNAYSFGRYFEPTQTQRVLMSGYLGSIGFAFPAAMGAWAATQRDERFKGRKVISVSGDGGFGQYAMEFTTAVQYQMNICHILLNNSELGKISKEQRDGEWPVWQTHLVNPAFAGFARSCGGHGDLVTEAGQLDAAIETALSIEGPALVEVKSDVKLL